MIKTYMIVGIGLGLGCCALAATPAQKETLSPPGKPAPPPVSGRAATNVDVRENGERPPQWAAPMTLEGVPNLHRVTPNLYRSAQPTAKGMQQLKEMGIETVVNLRSFHSDREEIGSTGLGYEHLYMKAWHPEDKELVRFLQIVSNPKRTPVLVHCKHGADRTGTLSAVYRMAVQGWSREDAIEEMREGGFGFHEVWVNIVPYLEKLDLEAIKKKAGLE